MKKIPNWRSQLYSYIEANKETEFKYGKFDCCLFGASVCAAQTDVDLAEKYRGKYRTALGGLKLLKKDGYSSYEDFIAKNFTEIEAPAFAQVGDIGIVDTDEGAAVCVVMGAFAVGLSQETGLVRFEINQLSKVYRV